MASEAFPIECRGGCGRDLSLRRDPSGICDECEAREYDKNAEAWREGK